ncbi:M23 family metallopeptidase [Georgenia ruanii]|uniref:M23 family metallopeptidase n=1 Tax=Georgenia ruanii TaxID=348442 RepID=UPI0012654F3D|nr:M23 family metallopeptidase [Georgenia ruanii]
MPAPQAPLTRRQIREAERAREAAAPAPASTPAPAPAAAAAATPFPTRSSLRAAERARAAAGAGHEAVAAAPAVAAAGTPAEAAAADAPHAAAAPTPAGAPPAPAQAVRTRAAARRAGQEAVSRPDPADAGAPPVGEQELTAGSAPSAERADRTPTEVLIHQSHTRPAASRRALREHAAHPVTHGRTRGWAPRAAVLGALGALTIVAPLTGLAGPDEASSAQALTAVDTEASLLDLLDAQSAATALAAAPASLLADPGAASRAAALQASRADDRDALTCTPDGANGVRAAVTERETQVVMPVAAGAYRLSSSYGYRNSPFTGYSMHLGEDFSAPLGTAIHAVADGTVDYVGVGKDGRSSMLVVLKHEIGGQTFYSWYVHMYPNGIHVREGQQVRAGDVIAEVGSNGNSTGPHLHLEIHAADDKTTLDPLTWLKEHGAVDVAALC